MKTGVWETGGSVACAPRTTRVWWTYHVLVHRVVVRPMHLPLLVVRPKGQKRDTNKPSKLKMTSPSVKTNGRASPLLCQAPEALPKLENVWVRLGSAVELDPAGLTNSAFVPVIRGGSCLKSRKNPAANLWVGRLLSFLDTGRFWFLGDSGDRRGLSNRGPMDRGSCFDAHGDRHRACDGQLLGCRGTSSSITQTLHGCHICLHWGGFGGSM